MLISHKLCLHSCFPNLPLRRAPELLLCGGRGGVGGVCDKSFQAPPLPPLRELVVQPSTDSASLQNTSSSGDFLRSREKVFSLFTAIVNPALLRFNVETKVSAFRSRHFQQFSTFLDPISHPLPPFNTGLSLLLPFLPPPSLLPSLLAHFLPLFLSPLSIGVYPAKLYVFK